LLGACCALAFAQAPGGAIEGSSSPIIEVAPSGMFEDAGPDADTGMVVACFADGTPQEYVDEVNARVDALNAALLGERYQLTSRWTGAQGNPITLTWSFAPDGLSIPGGIGEPTAPNNLFATMDAAFASQGGRTAWINRFQQVFDRWHALTGI